MPTITHVRLQREVVVVVDMMSYFTSQGGESLEMDGENRRGIMQCELFGGDNMFLASIRKEPSVIAKLIEG